jgi:hypothetical protein
MKRLVISVGDILQNKKTGGLVQVVRLDEVFHNALIIDEYQHESYMDLNDLTLSHRFI